MKRGQYSPTHKLIDRSKDSDLGGVLYLEIHSFIDQWLTELRIGVQVTMRGEKKTLNQEISYYLLFSHHNAASTSSVRDRTFQELEPKYKGSSSLLWTSHQDYLMFCHAMEWQACPSSKAAAVWAGMHLVHSLRERKLQTPLFKCAYHQQRSSKALPIWLNLLSVSGKQTVGVSNTVINWTL